MLLKVGLIGAGGIGLQHLRCYSTNSNCQPIALASRTEEHAKSAAKRFNISEYFVAEGWKSMLKDLELDVLSICTPNYLHAEMCLEAIDNNIHILCEKPICITFQELEKLNQCYQQKEKLIFFTSFQKRDNPIFPFIKNAIDNNSLGKIILVRYQFSHYGPYKSWRAISNERWFFDSEKAGGGVLLDLGVHCIDILRYLFGDFTDVEGINFNTSCIDMEYEDNCNVLFRFANNALGVISVSWCNEPSETIEIFGTKGTLKLNLFPKGSPSVAPRKLKYDKYIKEILSFQEYGKDTLQSLIDRFINCVMEGKQESPNFEDGKRAVEFVLKAYALKNSR